MSPSDFRAKNLLEWEKALHKIFGDTIPNHAEWTTLDEINDVLLAISGQNINHMFYPDGGGLDMESSRISEYKNCLEIETPLANICMPRYLSFENIGNEPEWCYFRLNLNELKPSGKYSEKFLAEIPMEDLYELSFDKFELPSDYPTHENGRRITRILKGCLLFVASSSYYITPETYAGTHNKYNDKSFRMYMEQLRASQTPFDAGPRTAPPRRPPIS